MWAVRYLPEAEEEYDSLDAREASAVDSAIAKLQAMGSDVEGADRLRELRPRAGRSVTRPLYRQFGRTFAIGAIGPEAEVDRRGFEQACRRAEERLDKVEE